jgi:hypothetical protein
MTHLGRKVGTRLERICIEPLPLRNNRKTLCVNCAVSDGEGIEEFIDVDMPNYGENMQRAKSLSE